MRTAKSSKRDIYGTKEGPSKSHGKSYGKVLDSHGIDFIATTGTGAKLFSSLVGASCVNEIVAITKGFSRFYPQAGSAIDIGGEDSKLIIFEPAGNNGTLRVKDFSMNALCAAGTGSFLDQQASRLCFTIEEVQRDSFEVEKSSTNSGPLHRICEIGHDPSSADRDA